MQVKQLVTELSEMYTLRIEAQLIASFGTVKTGGLLQNIVFATGKAIARRDVVLVTPGSMDRGQPKLSLL